MKTNMRWVRLVAVACCLASSLVKTAVHAEELPTAEQMAGWSAEQWADLAIAESMEVEGDARFEIQAYASPALAVIPARRASVLEMFRQAKAAWNELPADDPDDLEAVALARERWIYLLSRIGEDGRVDELVLAFDDPITSMYALIQAAWGSAERGDAARTRELLTEVNRRAEAINPIDRYTALADVALVCLLIEDADASEQRIEALADPSAKLYGLYGGADFALDLGLRDVATRWFARAEALLVETPDEAEWNGAYRAVLHAQLGDFDQSEKYTGTLDDFDRVWAWRKVAEAHHDAGNAEKVDWWLAWALKLTAQTRADGDWLTPVDVAFQWAEVGLGYRACERYEGLAEVWEKAQTPLNRGMIAAGIATELAWEAWLAERPDPGGD